MDSNLWSPAEDQPSIGQLIRTPSAQLTAGATRTQILNLSTAHYVGPNWCSECQIRLKTSALLVKHRSYRHSTLATVLRSSQTPW